MNELSIFSGIGGSDAEIYVGSGVGNLGEVHAVHGPLHGQRQSATLRIPPLGALWLRPPNPEDQLPMPARPAIM